MYWNQIIARQSGGRDGLDKLNLIWTNRYHGTDQFNKLDAVY